MRHALLQFTWLHLDISIIKNVEFMHTINDKWKYKLQQLFEKLSLSLDTGQAWSDFLHWSMALSTIVSLQSAKTLTSRCFSSARTCVAWCGRCHRNRALGIQPISSFSNAMNPQLNANVFLWKIIYNGSILTKLCQSILGVCFFLKHSVCWCVSLLGFTPDVKVWEVCFDKCGNFQDVRRAFELKGHTAGVHWFAFSADSHRSVAVSTASASQSFLGCPAVVGRPCIFAAVICFFLSFFFTS